MNPLFHPPTWPLVFFNVRDVAACCRAWFGRASAPPSAGGVVRGYRFSAERHGASS